MIFCTPFASYAASDSYLLRGIVRDSLTNDVVPFASVRGDKNIGTLSDTRGIFEITVPDTLSSLTIASQGYATRRLQIRKNRVNMYQVLLSPSAVTLDEVVIHRNRYSKKNNPAVNLMQLVRKNDKSNDPRQRPYYSYNKYNRVTIAINDFHTEEGGVLLRRFPFLAEHVDTSDVSGKPILPVSLKETSSNVYHRATGNVEREVITGLRSDGIDEIADREGMRLFVEDVLREIDIYDRDINILQNRFVSPLSPIAADFYKYYITDTIVTNNGDTEIVLSFYPHNKAVFGFVGQMIVEKTDSTVFVSDVSLRVPSEINLNFVESLSVRQKYHRGPQGERLKDSDDMTIEVSVLPGTPGLYVRRNVAYAGHNFEHTAQVDSVLSGRAKQKVESDANNRDDIFWQDVRLFRLPEREGNVALLMQRLRQNKLYYWGEKTVQTFVKGYLPTARDSRVDIGPLNTFIGGNSLEGLRLRVGGMTTANLSPHFFSRFYGAYGFRDHRWKYGFEAEWSFREKEYHSREFPMHSVRLNSSYDVDMLGQHYLFTSADNVFLALKRGDNDKLVYRRYNAVSYIMETDWNFAITAEVMDEQLSHSRIFGFRTTDGRDVPDIHAAGVQLTLRYAPNEKFLQTRSYRFPINLDAPVFTLTHLWCPSAVSDFSVNRTELSIMKRFWFSAWGYLDGMVSAGHIWSKNTPYTRLYSPNANLSYTIQPESFALVNPMEFVNDTYAQWFVTYWANGAILNYVPLLKRLRLREVFGCSGYWGRLDNRNNPCGIPNAIALSEGSMAGMANRPYVEASVGLDNIARCLRVDYVWRCTHRHQPYPISRSGLRIAFHVTF